MLSTREKEKKSGINQDIGGCLSIPLIIGRQSPVIFVFFFYVIMNEKWLVIQRYSSFFSY